MTNREKLSRMDWLKEETKEREKNDSKRTR